jgi:hypothetical protein
LNLGQDNFKAFNFIESRHKNRNGFRSVCTAIQDIFKAFHDLIITSIRIISNEPCKYFLEGIQAFVDQTVELQGFSGECVWNCRIVTADKI